MTGRGVYMFTENAAATLQARVPGIHVHLDKSSLTLVPGDYQGVGASSKEILDTLRWSLETDSALFVSTGHYGKSGKFFEVLTYEETGFLLGDINDSEGYSIPQTPAGLLVYSALNWALGREKMLADIGHSLAGYANESWLAAGVGPCIEDVFGLGKPQATRIADEIQVAEARIHSLERHNRRLGWELNAAKTKVLLLESGIRSAVSALLDTRSKFRSSVIKAVRISLQSLVGF